MHVYEQRRLPLTRPLSMHHRSYRPLQCSHLLCGINYRLIYFQNAVLIDCLLQYRKFKYASPMTIDRIIERSTP